MSKVRIVLIVGNNFYMGSRAHMVVKDLALNYPKPGFTKTPDNWQQMPRWQKTIWYFEHQRYTRKSTLRIWREAPHIGRTPYKTLLRQRGVPMPKTKRKRA